MAQKITHWLIVTLILSLGFGQLLRFDFYGIPLYLHDILVIIILAILFLQGLTCDWRSVIDVRGLFLDRRPEQRSSRDTGGGRRVLMGTCGLSIFLFALILSSIRALTLYPITSLLIPALYTLRLLAYLMLYLLLKLRKIKISHEVFFVAGMVTISIGLIQYIFMPDMRWAQYLGWDDHLYRLALPHFDPTFTGVMIGLFAISLTGLSTILAIPILLLSMTTIMLTYARSVWLSIVLIFSFIMLRNKKFSMLIIGICILVIPILFLPKKFGEGTNLLRTYSISSRAESDISYVKKYNWDLLIGRGMNTTILDSAPSDISNHATGPNNSYLYLLTMTGILGLVGWGMFMTSLCKSSTHKYTLAFFFIASLFNNVMFYPFALLWVLLLESTAPSAV